jgi:hypothetical protein
MKNRMNPRDKIVQRSVGFNFRQIEFFNKYPDFRPDEFCRKAIDEQIEMIDKEFLKNEN